MIEELQAAWDRPGEISLSMHGEDLQFSDGTTWDTPPGWAMGWKITRPVKMWLGNQQNHSYGAWFYGDDKPDRAEVFGALGLMREQFDVTMEQLDRPAWQRFIDKHLPGLDFRIRHHAELLALCKERGVSLSLAEHVRALLY